MTPIGFGYVLVVLGLLWFAFKAHVSFDTEGGSMGMVPVLDGALGPPTMWVFGARLIMYPSVVGKHWQPLRGLDWFLLGVLWLSSVFLAFVIIDRVGKLGEKEHRRHQENR